ncbi:MAG: sodium:proton antiporter, partial [Actinobacteria bacterium]
MGALAIVAVCIVAYSLAAKRLEALNITGPIVFIVAGIVVNLPAFSLTSPGTATTGLRITSVLTLTLLLFDDASTVDLAALRRDAAFPLRLLLIGLPLTVALGTAVARGILPPAGVGIAALIAAILAPTDLSLGLAMFANDKVPDRVRRAINVESGLNDGIAAPLVAVFTALAIAEFDQSSYPLVEAVREIGIGTIAGALVGVTGAWLLVRSLKASWSSGASRQFATAALAVLAYVASTALHGNGFIAAFVGGLAFGAVAKRDAVESAEFAEEAGTLLSLAVWFMFGTSLLPALKAAGWTWQPIAYAALSLTVIRMVPVALALIGSKTHGSTKLFVGWFGPRGLASVVFLLQAIDALKAAGVDTTMLAATVAWTILGSVVLHGASAAGVAAWYS